MTTSERKARPGPALSARATWAGVTDSVIQIELEDGRALAVPLGWFPRLLQARAEERSNLQLIGRGVGIHWPDLDEDVSVANLLGSGDEMLAYQHGYEPGSEAASHSQSVESLEDEVLKVLPKAVDLMAALKASIETAQRSKDLKEAG